MHKTDRITDLETERSFSRQAYGHEMWLENTERDGNIISVYGLYGHKLLPDKPMPTDYANALLYDDNGRADNPEREIVRRPSGWKFSFEDKGADVYTFYIDSNSVWITNKEGWHRGSKRDYTDANFSSAYSMVAKRIISRDGKNPGNVMHSALEIMPEKATLKVGAVERFRILYEEKPLKGAIVAVGQGTKDEEMVLKVGDQVLYGKYAGTELEHEGKKYLIMRQSDVVAILA